MFYDNDSFSQEIGLWGTSNVNDMSSMFDSAYSFNECIGNWGTSNVTDMKEMFSYAASFNQDLSSSCVTNISSLPNGFSGGSSDLSSNWKDVVSMVTRPEKLDYTFFFFLIPM